MPVASAKTSAALPRLAETLASDLSRLGFSPQTDCLGLAVSGGGDSMALLHLVHALGLRAKVATVDHGLRPEARDEAMMVASIAADMGYSHDILQWQGWNGQGNIQDMARRARRSLLAEWGANLGAVALAHTQDDVAETYLMRLARGAGVDGLAMMQPRFTHNGTAFLRPMLWADRGDLRSYLAEIGAKWVDDPSNDQTRFDRVRMRKALPDLHHLGLSKQVLASVAQNMRAASDALDWACDDLMRAHVTHISGTLQLSQGWQDAPFDLQRRLFQRLVLWIAPTDYAPRAAALGAAIARVSGGQATQLAGCHFLPHQGGTLLFREASQAAPPCPASQIWDGVWHLGGDAPQGAQIRALSGAGLTAWPTWRDTGLPRAALASQPSLWLASKLIATPLHTQLSKDFTFFRLPATDSLYSMRLSD